MVFNIRFWERYIRKKLIPQATFFVKNIETRLLPTFDDMKNEANNIRDREWEKLCSSCASPDMDPGDLAEIAQVVGFEYYSMVGRVQQALLNVSAVTLYHLFEQQVFFFLRKVLLDLPEENNIHLFKLEVFKARCLNKKIDVEKFSTWDTINEMKLVSNTIKHAEGLSSINLRKIRPDLFIHPILNNDEFFQSEINRPLYLPLAGEDLFLSIKDLKKYADTIEKFWEEMISAFMNDTD